jgi:hypothetical protein
MTRLEPNASQEEVPAGAAALLQGLIDYAGLFPPAALSMQETVDNYADFCAHADAWMLARLIVPVDRLDEFESCAAARLPRDGDPWELSALTVAAGDERLAAQLERITAFNASHERAARGLARIGVIELKAATAAAADAALDLLPDEIFPFFEIPLAADPRGLLTALVGSDAGAKARTGGVEASAYPSAEHLARFIGHCAAAGVPFKATAGLHHPLRHRNAAVGVSEFGFLNVFMGAILAWHDLLEPGELTAILDDGAPDSFALDDQGAAWRDLRLGVEEIVAAREAFAVSFGSCSFDEPRQDLRRLGMLGT